MGWEKLDGWSGEDVHEVQLRGVANARRGEALIEVGVAYGRSLARLARAAIDSGKGLPVIGVDAWKHDPAIAFGGGEERTARVNASGGYLEDCMRGMSLECNEEHATICYWQATSVDAARGLATSALTEVGIAFVFVDADHSYGSVRADIAAWLPLVRPGGIISGHDLNVEFPGVRQAVEEAFGSDFEHIGDCWLHVVKERKS